jgi:enoyl-[acyl-carrier-protein] reductase (NADH)
LLTSNALGRMVSAEEIGTAAAFLISDDAAAITGVNLPVDCGWLVATTWNTYGGLRTQSHE